MGFIRVTKGQQAAIHGLILAGVGYVNACKIVGGGAVRMRPYVGDEWRRSTLPVPLRKMTPKQYRLYRKLREETDRTAAFAEAMR